MIAQSAATIGAAIVLIDDTIAATIVLSDARTGAGIGMDTVAIVNIVVVIAATATATTIQTTCSSCSFANCMVVTLIGGGFLSERAPLTYPSSAEAAR